ncbi:MAG: hypothetical protein PVI97_19225 [Candidatus Thiodiazotropha sp.]|jgi:hypothetical protein
MTDFNTAVQAAMKKLTENGSIEAVIEKQLLETVKNIVHDQLRSYSDFGKALKQKIDDELRIDLQHITFSEYNQVVLNLVQGQLNNAVTGEAHQKLKDDLDELLETPPKEIRLSDVIDKYKEESSEFDRDGAERITLIIEPKEYGQIAIALHPKTTKGYRDERISSWTDCDFFMSIRVDDHDDTRGRLTRTHDRTGLKPHQFMPTCMHGLSRLMYQMYCAGSLLILDQGLEADDYDLYYSDECCC